MYINQEFINGINASSPHVKMRMTIDGVVYNSDDHITSASFEFVAKSFIGEFPSWKLTIKLHYDSKPDYRNKEAFVEVGSFHDNIVTYIPIGHFYIDVDGQETDEIVKEVMLTMFDAAYFKFKATYIPTLTYPCTGLDLMIDVCNQAGVSLELPESMLLDQFTFDEELNMPTDASLREVVMHYAAANLAIAYVNRSGNLTFQCVFNQLNPAHELSSTHDFLSDFTHDELSEYSHNDLIDLSIDKSIFTIDDYSYNALKAESQYGPINSINLARVTEGDDLAYDEVIVDDEASIEDNGLFRIRISDNYFLDNVRELVAQSLFELSRGFSYVPYDINIFARPDIDPGDLIVLKDSNDVEYRIPVVNISHEFNGGMMSTFKLNVLDQTLEKYNPLGVSKDLRRVSIKADKVNGQIVMLAEEVNTLDSRIQSTEAVLEPQSFRIKVKQADTDNYGNVLEEVSKNFVFDDQGLKIGASNSSKSMKVDEESIKFMDGATTLASLSGESGLDVSRARITQSIIVGVHKIEKYDDETTIVRFIGVS